MAILGSGNGSSLSGGGGGGGTSTAATEPIEFIPISGDVATDVDGIELEGTIDASGTTGQNAPKQKMEEGREYTTRVGPNPIEPSITAWVLEDTLNALQQLRHERAPFSMATKGVILPTCTLDTLDWKTSGEHPNAYEVTINIRQVLQSSIGISQIRARTATGNKKGKPTGKDHPDPTVEAANQKKGQKRNKQKEGLFESIFT